MGDMGEDVRRQLADVDAPNTQVLIPISELGPALEDGQSADHVEGNGDLDSTGVADPAFPKVGEILVEFPLKVIAPFVHGAPSNGRSEEEGHGR
jgi:hypothetical protein